MYFRDQVGHSDVEPPIMCRVLFCKCPISKPLFKKIFVIMSVLVLKLKMLRKKLIVRDKMTHAACVTCSKMILEHVPTIFFQFLSLGSAEEALEELDNKERNDARELEQEIDPNHDPYDDPFDLRRESEKELKRDSFKPEDTFGEGSGFMSHFTCVIVTQRL